MEHAADDWLPSNCRQVCENRWWLTDVAVIAPELNEDCLRGEDEEGRHDDEDHADLDAAPPQCAEQC